MPCATEQEASSCTGNCVPHALFCAAKLPTECQAPCAPPRRIEAICFPGSRQAAVPSTTEPSNERSTTQTHPPWSKPSDPFLQWDLRAAQERPHFVEYLPTLQEPSLSQRLSGPRAVQKTPEHLPQRRNQLSRRCCRHTLESKNHFIQVPTTRADLVDSTTAMIHQSVGPQAGSMHSESWDQSALHQFPMPQARKKHAPVADGKTSSNSL